MNFKKVLITTLMMFSSAVAGANEISFTEVKGTHDVFKVSSDSEVNFSYTYDSFSNWKSKLSGRFFELEPAPVLKGLVEGVTAPTVSTQIDPSDYVDQAAEFAEHTKSRLEDGRPTFPLKEGDAPEALLEKRLKNTHVIEMKMSAVLDLPFENIGLSEELAQDLAENIDYDHYHFQVPGSLVSSALEDSHVARTKLNESKNYLLSVFDFRDYECAFMKDGITDYFSKKAEPGETDKGGLVNNSIYLLSDIKFNDSVELEKASAYFGKKPDGLISQETIYADHLIRASKLYFAFFKEEERTRVALLSNLALGSKFLSGTKASLIKPYLFNGVGGYGNLADKGLKVKKAYDKLNEEGLSAALGDLFTDAEEDIERKNTCETGLALGLVKYSQNIFTEFSEFVKSK